MVFCPIYNWFLPEYGPSAAHRSMDVLTALPGKLYRRGAETQGSFFSAPSGVHFYFKAGEIPALNILSMYKLVTGALIIVMLVAIALVFRPRSQQVITKNNTAPTEPEWPWEAPDTSTIPHNSTGDLIRYGRLLVEALAPDRGAAPARRRPAVRRPGLHEMPPPRGGGRGAGPRRR